ncbi:MAG: hypothetical protein AB1507_01250 [Bacillota bacterium]|nr:hypothetical protein [Thermoanaerobacteraceae bacterium]
MEEAVQTAGNGLRLVQAQYKVGLVGRDKLREAEAAQHSTKGDVTLTGKVDVQRKPSTVADIGDCLSELSAGRTFTASHKNGNRLLF